MKTKTCLSTCIQPGEIACGAAVSLDRTLLCDLEEVCDGLQLHGSRPLASKRDELRSVTGCAHHAHVFFGRKAGMRRRALVCIAFSA